MSAKSICSGSALLVICLGVQLGFAQNTRSEEIQQKIAAKEASLQPPQREAGDVIVSDFERIFMPQPPSLRLSLGDFRPGAGLAAGAAYDIPVMGTGLWTSEAAWSVHNFKQAGTRLHLPAFAHERLGVSASLVWNDAPGLWFFGLGNTSSPADRVDYGLRSTEARVQAEGQALSWFRYGGNVGYLDTRLEAGSPIVGLGAGPAWIQSGAFVAVDTRESPGYTRHGQLYRLSFNRYQDRDGKLNFNRTEVDLRQFIPVLHENWVIAFQGRADFVGSASGQPIPFFMLPALGGRDTLPGYAPYRFTDNDSLMLRSELRWFASPVLDMAAIVDHGMVAPKPADFNLRALHRDIGVGARFHGSMFTAFRLEIFHSVEGWHYNVAKSISF